LYQGRNLYPKSKKILKELYSLHISVDEKLDAKSIAQTLIKLNPKNGDNYFLLGKVYASLIETDEAKQSYMTGLEYKHGMSMEELMRVIQKGFAENPDEVLSEYVFISGRNNFGSLIHSYQGKKYFTKISENITLAKRENKFYKEVCEDFPLLKEQVPAYIDSQVIDNLLYLTLEMIDADTIKRERIKDVLAISQKISSIPYDEITNKHPNLNYSFGLHNKPNPMVIIFTQIHRK